MKSDFEKYSSDTLSRINSNISYSVNLQLYRDGQAHIRDIVNEKNSSSGKALVTRLGPRQLSRGLRQILEEKQEVTVISALTDINTKLDKLITLLASKTALF